MYEEPSDKEIGDRAHVTELAGFNKDRSYKVEVSLLIGKHMPLEAPTWLVF